MMSSRSKFFVILIVGLGTAVGVFAYLLSADKRTQVQTAGVSVDGEIEYLLTVSDSAELDDIERDLMATELRDLSGEFSDAVELFNSDYD